MKFLFALTVISLHSSAGTLCEVYGISDSPQSLTCHFQRNEIKLTCDDGTYLLGGVMVEAAYHLEVEEGPTPLVFHTKSGDLTVTLNSGRHHTAFLSADGKRVRGHCVLN